MPQVVMLLTLASLPLSTGCVSAPEIPVTRTPLSGNDNMTSSTGITKAVAVTLPTTTGHHSRQGGAGQVSNRQGASHVRPGKDVALPCRLLPWSGYRAETSRTYYALSNSSVWVHQADSGGWTELRSTLVSSFVDGWKVRCELPTDQVIAVANASSVLVYHRASAKWWNLSGTEAESRPEDAKLVWCYKGAVHVYSAIKRHLLRHDTRSLKVIVSTTNSLPLNYSISPETRLYYWFLSNGSQLYALIERPRNASSVCNCSLLMQSSTEQSELSWSIVDQWSHTTQTTKPSPSDEALTWSDGTQSLWLWPGTMRDHIHINTTTPRPQQGSELWQFELESRIWRKRSLDAHDNSNNNIHHNYISNLKGSNTYENNQYSASMLHRRVNSSQKPNTGESGAPLMGWTDGSRTCGLFNLGECREPFSLVRPVCLQVAGLTNPVRRPGNNKGVAKGPKTRPSKRPPRVQLLSTMRPPPTHPSNVTPPRTITDHTTPFSTSSSAGSVALWSDEAAAVDTENSVIAVTTEDLADEEVDGDELDLELGSPWHDSESGVFDSVVFCATSAVALCLVSALWCVRHCAPFPKEALLPLRDPPSVRYTAIPDHTLA
ncbi:uncharacterized protein LOC111253150 isoform X1 [Varroa destructor]|uniref:Uncharacterized protein n=1 Tax=Varroa destructor TaxID=109461 RepID=A0A7M7KRV7_VARDE|nr:uncharacterized protein LOC111253150 isoform X1 [Varroa destructor]XP_022667893.1 uncharacterized protein LOC111253150 isoform X1 [Varroa destructor]XP_022667894.1 uncharacterized protein LOC111253150 isoform X1 [Varroa destructor]